MAKKILILGMAVIMIFSLGACSDNKYNAVLYDNAVSWKNEEFYKRNLLYGTYCEDTGMTILDENYLRFKAFVIKTQTELEDSFAEFPPGINFEWEMLLLFIFSSQIPTSAFVVKKIIVEDKTIKISFVADHPPIGPGVSTLHWFAVKIDKLDIDTAEFLTDNLYVPYAVRD